MRIETRLLFVLNLVLLVAVSALDLTGSSLPPNCSFRAAISCAYCSPMGSCPTSCLTKPVSSMFDDGQT